MTEHTFNTEIKRLVSQFQRNLSTLHTTVYDEATLRLQFLDPFFRALGWDVTNEEGLPLHLADVVVESRTNIAGRQKRADYVFRYGGMNKFVCEAKKPAEDLSRHAFQIQNYTYNLSLYLGVLTNFEYLHVYVVGAQPDKERPFDPVLTVRFDEYEQRCEELWRLLAREMVIAGSLDKYVLSIPKSRARGGKQGWLFRASRTRTVDEDFLDFLDDVRGRFARSLVKTNPSIDWGESGLNEAVQRIIDRILFVRICEDRDIETFEPLGSLVNDWMSGGSMEGQLIQRS
ncbi:MAG: hypothetical protein ACR2JB_18260 [Bryobacteraceae bacterium]